jgi:general secretion pathway protein B
MSYILDALKKADAEREREGVPSIHAQHAVAPLAFEPAGSPSQGARWAMGGAVAGLVVVAGAWALLQDTSIGNSAQPTGGAALVAAQGVQPPVAEAPDVPRPMAAEASTKVKTPVIAQHVTPPPAELPAQVLAPEAQPASKQAAARAEPASRAAIAGSTGPAASPTRGALRVDATLSEVPARVVPLAELPDEVRRALPSLSIGGAMHSDVPANRMLVLNGGVFHEGDQPAPGLMLEEIKLKSATFRFKGHRYSVAY